MSFEKDGERRKAHLTRLYRWTRKVRVGPWGSLATRMWTFAASVKVNARRCVTPSEGAIVK